jgi:cation-transporting ATPase 13A1
VFQVLCLFLWSLDDYWYYSLFTLFMLLLFEGVMCNQRQNNVLMMRNMRRPAFQIFAYRTGKWMVISSDAIVPGDILSLTSDTAIEAHATAAMSRKKSVTNEGKVVPCDVLLLRGNCVVNEAMLTGESTPKVKESIPSLLAETEADTVSIDVNHTTLWARHTLLGGTLLQQHNNSATTLETRVGDLLQPPDMGCLALALRTGFATTQGELMRKILFATEGVTGATNETFSFIGILVLFALFAALLVLKDGLQDMERNKFRLALHCIMIITSVVPPELPMELSLAITNSLTALSRSMVYCTEPFRISFAGKLDVVCFDKTGTLTKDEMILKGVAAVREVDLFAPRTAGGDKKDDDEDEDADLFEANSASDLVKCIMGTCHDLVHKNNHRISGSEGVLGDPLELAAFEASGFSFVGKASGSFSPFALLHEDLQVVSNTRYRFPFNSELKRMSAIVTLVRRNSQDEVSYVFCKGAPEVLHDHLQHVPASYAAIYRKFMQSGKRVLALAYRPLTKQEGAATSSSRLSRSQVERGLLFAGFLVFDCDLKADSKSVIKELHGSQHRVVMITGDSVYTAANVARRLTMVDTQKNVMVLVLVTTTTSGKGKEEEQLVWRRTDLVDVSDPLKDVDDIDYSLAGVASLSSSYTLCVTGSALDALHTQSKHEFAHVLKTLSPLVSIFARVSPQQKERVLLALNDSGAFTLMCGDGTNDVGALKAAHVGVSIVNNPKLETKVEAAAAEGATAGASGKKKGKSLSKGRLVRAMLELKENEADPSLVKLGDASIASPFTAKRTSVDCVLTVIRQGRCTLVTTIQVYKVLALNCLASAYMMSSLYIKGLKQGDTQMTCSGLVVATLFFFLSQAKPLLTISESRPPSSVFNPAVTLSILGQFLTHLACMWATMHLCETYAHPDDAMRSLPDGKFTPNLVNTAMFVLSNQMQVNNFWINYRGHPYMEELRQNTYFWMLLQGVYVALLIVVGGQFEPLNDLLQLVSLPSRDFQIYFLAILAGNAAAAYLIERVCRTLE